MTSGMPDLSGAVQVQRCMRPTIPGTSFALTEIGFGATVIGNLYRVTFGMRSSQQIGRNAEPRRAPALWSDLRAQALISPDVPTAAGRVRCH
jgi:hypothetical protein